MSYYKLSSNDTYSKVSEEELIEHAYRKVIEKYGKKSDVTISDPKSALDFLKLKFNFHNERFVVVFLTSKRCIIDVETMFVGTINQCSVPIREVVKRALELNAGALILAHNHPSGIAEPSIADKTLTAGLENACKLIDVKILDHFIFAGEENFSFAQSGLMSI